jgi:hypothetical protein
MPALCQQVAAVGTNRQQCDSVQGEKAKFAVALATGSLQKCAKNKTAAERAEAGHAGQD